MFRHLEEKQSGCAPLKSRSVTLFAWSSRRRRAGGHETTSGQCDSGSAAALPVKELMERLKELCPSSVIEEENDGENEDGDSEELVRVNTTQVRLTSARSFPRHLGMS